MYNDLHRQLLCEPRLLYFVRTLQTFYDLITSNISAFDSIDIILQLRCTVQYIQSHVTEIFTHRDLCINQPYIILKGHALVLLIAI